MAKKQLTFKKSTDDIMLDKEPMMKLVEKSEPSNGVSEIIKDLLQKQVNHEFSNELLYLSMALWCDENGYVETAKFFSAHALEERKHGMDFINHMSIRRIPVMPPKAEEPKRDFECLCDILEDAVKREDHTMKMVLNLRNKASELLDSSVSIADKYVTEQLEEEQLFKSVLNLHKLCGDSKIDFEMEISQIKCSDKYKFGKLL